MSVVFVLETGASEKLLAKRIFENVAEGFGAIVFAKDVEQEEKLKFELRRGGAYEICENEKRKLEMLGSNNDVLKLPFVKKASEELKINSVLYSGLQASIIKMCFERNVIAVLDAKCIEKFKKVFKNKIYIFDEKEKKESKIENKKGSALMEVNSSSIEAIVKQVLANMGNGDSAAPKAASNAKTSRAAMLTGIEKIEMKEFPIPELGDDDVLVKVEGCGICGTDAHEYKRDPFGLIPVLLGHEGTGEIVKMGKNVKKDSAGKALNIGDKVVTCMIFKDNPDITMFDLNKQNVGGADVYGLVPDDDVHLNGWFADYIVVRGGSTIFNVSDLDLDSRILIEPSAVLIHAVERAKSTNILRFNSNVVVQGCGPIGLICIAVLRTLGIENITAVDGEAKRLEFARKMGADKTVNFKDYKSTEELAKAVEDSFDGHLADFAFQCTGSPVAHSNIYKFIRSGGGLCELGFFINGGDATINPHFDICSKEITTVGSWVYTLRDYATTFDFLKRAKAIGLPMGELITHKYPLSEIDEAFKTNIKMEGLKIAVINEK